VATAIQTRGGEYARGEDRRLNRRKTGAPGPVQPHAVTAAVNKDIRQPVVRKEMAAPKQDGGHAEEKCHGAEQQDEIPLPARVRSAKPFHYYHLRVVVQFTASAAEQTVDDQIRDRRPVRR
jgi:hypothetical protein